jgi:hypothetical protein
MKITIELTLSREEPNITDLIAQRVYTLDCVDKTKDVIARLDEGWRPISEAPKDEFFLAIDEFGEMQVSLIAGDEEEGYFLTFGNVNYEEEEFAGFKWMALPQSQKETA